MVRRAHRLYLQLILIGGLIVMLPGLHSGKSHALLLAGYATAVMAWCALPRTATNERFGPVLFIALLIRLTLLFPTPSLSGDVYRYLWDGHVSAAGINPYLHSPDAPELVPLRTSWHRLINHPTIPTIYPPAAQLLFFISAISGTTLIGWKLLLLLFDLAAALLLRSHSSQLALLYLFCPLVLIEVSWNGHLEGAVTVLLLFSVIAAKAGRWNLSGGALALAVLTKITPAAALPGLLRESRGKSFPRFTVITAAMTLPFLLSGSFMSGFRDYARSWSFNSPAYAAVARAIEVTNFAEPAKRLFTSVKDPMSLEFFAPLVYRSLYPALIARAILAVLLVLSVFLILRKRRSIESTSLLLIGSLLLLSPTIHPWYWVPLVPLSLLTGNRFFTATALCSPFSYLLYDGVPVPLVWTACYGIPLLALLLYDRFPVRRETRVLQPPASTHVS